MKTITTTAELEVVCDRLSHAKYVTVDTEFLRESTYWALLCLIQVADKEDAHAIDPLADGIDLTPFWDLMKNQNVLKVFHASRQDIEIFYKEMGAIPEPLFDTQVAAMVSGFGDSVGYETLVNKIPKKHMDKSTRHTDWSRRPLTDKQIEYAIGDVTHLRDIFEHLSEKLQESGRGPWLDEEMEILSNPATYDLEPREMWKRLKVRTNKPRVLGVLREVAAWREERAKYKDMPRRRVMKDETLLEIAANPPKNEEGLDKLRGVGRGFSRSHAGGQLLDAIEVAVNLPEDELPQVDKKKARPATPPMADLLKVLLKIRCQETGVAPRLIANAADLEQLASMPESDIKAVTGWRRDIFGGDALKLIQGRLALSADRNGNIAVVKVAEEGVIDD